MQKFILQHIQPLETKCDIYNLNSSLLVSDTIPLLYTNTTLIRLMDIYSVVYNKDIDYINLMLKDGYRIVRTTSGVNNKSTDKIIDHILNNKYPNEKIFYIQYNDEFTYDGMQELIGGKIFNIINTSARWFNDIIIPAYM